jgi:hypothetical protein
MPVSIVGVRVGIADAHKASITSDEAGQPDLAISHHEPPALDLAR